MPYAQKGERRGGRKPGATNVRTRIAKDIADGVLSSGESPLEFLVKTYRDETQDMAVRIDAAKAAAPYVHPKLATVEHKGDPENPIIQIDDMALARWLALKLQAGAMAANGETEKWPMH
jgi:hypothetical protein